MKRVFTGGIYFTLSLLLIGALSAGAAGTLSVLPGNMNQERPPLDATTQGLVTAPPAIRSPGHGLQLRKPPACPGA